MLPMRLEVLVVIVVVAIWVIVPVLLRSPKVMHLLRACSELIWTTVSTHWHFLMLVWFNYSCTKAVHLLPPGGC